MPLYNLKALSRITLAGLAIGSSGLASAQCQVMPISSFPIPTALPSDGHSTIARQGDLMAVGFPNTNSAFGFNVGSANVYHRVNDQWSLVTTLMPNDLGDQDSFGASVALDGDTIVVGASRHDAAGMNAGAAYVYHYDGSAWTLQQKILPSQPNGQDSFGQAVALSGDTMLIGAPGNNSNGNFAGAVYAYTFDGSAWTLESILHPTENDALDFFGQSIDIDGTRSAIGAIRDEFAGPGSPETGSVAIYDRDASGWTQSASLHPTSSGAIFFGYSVSIDGPNVLVGAPNTSIIFRDAGSAYLYTFDGTTWNNGTNLTPFTISAADRFGAFVEIDGPVAIVSAPEDRQYPIPNPGPGHIYIYTNDGSAWSLDQSYFGGLSGFVNYATFGDAPTLEGNDLVLATGAQDLNTGELTSAIISFDLGCEQNICLPDVNGDGALDSADFTAWIATFNSGDPAADQNQDGLNTPADFTAWVANFNMGCPNIN